jgi:hypothetical protein
VSLPKHPSKKRKVKLSPREEAILKLIFFYKNKLSDEECRKLSGMTGLNSSVINRKFRNRRHRTNDKLKRNSYASDPSAQALEEQSGMELEGAAILTPDIDMILENKTGCLCNKSEEREFCCISCQTLWHTSCILQISQNENNIQWIEKEYLDDFDKPLPCPNCILQKPRFTRAKYKV